ncbi:histidine phosphatase family protein [Geobacillus thermodenitrificans]|uniref:histidine phosphatase family protein n=3 Tax=Geobacillus thermodenitrificans TaxID=33940 RepID=UPI003D25B81A
MKRLRVDHHTICAEVSSTLSFIRDQLTEEEPQDLYLLTSDTPDGKKIGNILKLYFQAFFRQVHVFSIENLNGEKPELFKNEGLRNLVKTIVQIVRVTSNRGDRCVINATGGYKAQISFAGLIGQVLKIPVYYQFEGFPSVVQLPEMPISFDYKIWLRHFRLFWDLYRLGVVSIKLLPKHVDLSPLNGLIEYQSKEQIRLSSVGWLMHEVLWNQFKEHGRLYLPPVAEDEGQEGDCEWGNDLPLHLQTMLQTIQRLPFVTSVQIVGTKDQISGPMTFTGQGDSGVIRGSYSHEQKTWLFDIQTTAVDEMQVNAAIVELYQRFEPLVQTPSEKSVEFILVRHGQHVGEKEERIEGWADFELTDVGHKQAQLVAQYLKQNYPGIDALYTSSLMRARQTAEHIGRELGIQPLVLDDLRAMNYGKPSGLTKKEAEILYPVPPKQVIFNRAYDGESELEFHRRVVELFYELAHRHQGKTVCIVTHGRAINAILKEVMNLPLSHDFRVDSADTSIHHFVMRQNQTLLRRVNHTDHLVALQMDTAK